MALVIRAARLVAAAVCIGLGLAMIWANAISWGLEDWRTYLAAADRVAGGGGVYLWTGEPEHVYRYAPWFAYALVPLLALPRTAVDVIWSGLVVAGTLAAVYPLLRRPTLARLALAALMAGLLMRVASTGNIHPILVAGLILGLPTRFAPLLIALAASLKATPFLFVAVLVAERRWLAAVTATVLTVLLVAPMLWLGYETAAGPSQSLFALSPRVWAAATLAATAVLTILALRRHPWTTLAAGVAAYVALPRSFLYDITLVMPGVVRPNRGTIPDPRD